MADLTYRCCLNKSVYRGRGPRQQPICPTCNKPMKKNIVAAVLPCVHTGNLYRTFVSEAMGVHPDQVDDAQRESLAAGISIQDAEFIRDGEMAGAVKVTKRGRQQMMKMLGLHDRSAYR